MGFYLRKSVKAGPFRFSLSKSGIGISSGIPGFRVGTGPRGNYVTIGSNGISYRATSPGSTARMSPPPTTPSLVDEPSEIVMEDVTGVPSMALMPTGGGDVVDQLNVAARRISLGWPTTIVAFVIGLLIMPFGLILWALAAPLCWWLFLRDQARRTVVLFYDVSDAPAVWFDQLVTNWDWLIQSQMTWRILESGKVQTTYQHKTNAGADNLVRRMLASAGLTGPRHLSTNVAVPSITSGNTGLHFLPDRALVRDEKHYSDISYENLVVRGSQNHFIETGGSPPSDAAQVGQTWKYVNVKGGPDRRYSNNPVFPVMLYGTIEITSPQGLNWLIQTSRADSAGVISRALSR